MKLKKAVYIVNVIALSFFLIYLLQPVGGFPTPADSLQSNEPGDTEDPLRRSYFLDLDRQQVINHYIGQLNYMPVIRLNYPPEEAQTIIRDQTRSSYLEEITQPFRLSLYVNGFVPSQAKDEILINDRHFEQKITIRYVPTSLSTRIFIFVLIAISSFALIEAKFYAFKLTKEVWLKK